VLLDKDYRIILASKSPRRSELLRQAGLPFVVKTKEVSEEHPEGVEVEDIAVFLAHKKASASTDFLEQPTDVILAADSVVILDGEIFEKPKDKTQARQMLGRLSGREHKVVTGVCLMTKDKTIQFGEHSIVKFAELSPAEIDYYIDNYQPFDKAGSYGIQEWIGLCKIEYIQGTYANIMGLPVHRVWKSLEEMFM